MFNESCHVLFFFIFFFRQVQVLTCILEESFPAGRIKEFWVPVAMSGQVAALVESTQLLWLMQHNAEQVFNSDQLN